MELFFYVLFLLPYFGFLAFFFYRYNRHLTLPSRQWYSVSILMSLLVFGVSPLFLDKGEPEFGNFLFTMMGLLLYCVAFTSLLVFIFKRVIREDGD